MHRKPSIYAGILVLTAAFLGYGCDGTTFSSSSKGSGSRTNTADGQRNVSGNLNAEFQFSSQTRSLKITAAFAPKTYNVGQDGDYTQAYEVLQESVLAVPSGGFPTDLAQKLSVMPLSASVQYIAAQRVYVIRLVMSFRSMVVNGKAIADQDITLTQTNGAQSWVKDEGVFSALGSFDNSTVATACTLKPSGDQPHPGVYYVALTQPSDCDFNLPKVKVAGRSLRTYTEVDIGHYWLSAGTAAHQFPTTTAPIDSQGAVIDIDNGFILVQPDHISYLLVDAGHATNRTGSAKSANDVANQISQSVGYGATTLMQPNAATVFKQKSIIAMYDDTPDMGGQIDVNALVTSAVAAKGMNLNWNASVK